MKKRHVLCVFLLLASVVLSSCGKTEDGGNGANGSAINKEPVYVNSYCEDTTYIQTGREIALYYEWITQTKEQNEAYFDLADHYLSVDGVPLEIKEQGNEEIMELGDGTFRQMFWMNIGILEPGTYEIFSAADISEPVFDGWDWYGPGSEFESLMSICTITVGDEPPADLAVEEDGEELPTDDVPEVPPSDPAPAVCSINSPLKQEWDSLICETFDGDTNLWTGQKQGTSAHVESGEYVLDNSTKVSSGYKTGFIFQVDVEAVQDHMISVDGYMDSNFRSCMWGVFVRSTSKEIGYFFMINNEGRYTLTGSSNQGASRSLGNLKNGNHKAIIWDGTNNITVVVEGKLMEFYVNDELLVTHDAINAVDPNFGLIVWGGEGVSAVNYFDNLLVRSK